MITKVQLGSQIRRSSNSSPAHLAKKIAIATSETRFKG